MNIGAMEISTRQFMGSAFFDGISADHIGPISLGFVHDPRYLQPMKGGENSAKRDRLQVADIEKIIETEQRTGIYPMSWYSRKIWEYIKRHYAANPSKVGGAYRDALKQNMANYMYILWYILEHCPENGEAFLVSAFLQPNFKYFDYAYAFNSQGEIISKVPRHYTARSQNEAERYCRIAIDAVYDYMDKDNRNTMPDLTHSDRMFLEKICSSIHSGMNPAIVKQKIAELLESIQDRIIMSL